MSSGRELPEELWRCILGKLPLWSQWEARGTCKAWEAMVSSRTLDHAVEEFILVNCVSGVRWYNITQRRWLTKKMTVESLSLPLPPSDERRRELVFLSVFQELLFFHHYLPPDYVRSWNALTGETKVYENPGNASQICLDFGACKDKVTGELKLLTVVPEPVGSRLVARFFIYGAERGVWTECPPADPKIIVGLYPRRCGNERWMHSNFNNLVSGGSLVPYFHELNKTLTLHNVDANKFTTCVFHEIPHMDNSVIFLLGGGIYLVGSSTVDGVLCYRADEGMRWEIAAQTPKELVDFNSSRLGFCSDGLENIWSVMPGCKTMLQYNVRTKEWTGLPCTLPVGSHLPFLNIGHESYSFPGRLAFYTKF